MLAILGGTTTTYGYDDNNKLLTVNGVTSCTYDGNGNLTNSYANLPAKDMAYNDDNRLTSIAYGGTTDYYYYTYTGLRYRATLAGATYRYLYNGTRVLEELTDSGTMTARYTTEKGCYSGMLLHLYRPTGSLSRFPMYDNIGTVRGLVDASGTVTDTYELDTFGRQVSTSGTTLNPYRYGGGWGYITDPSGMLQLGHRFYWPELGRFVSQDPIRDGTNWYVYADSDPTRRSDPTGLSWCEAKCMAKLVAQAMACGAAYQAEMFACARAVDLCELRLGIGHPICKAAAVTCGNAALAQYYQCEAWATRKMVSRS